MHQLFYTPNIQNNLAVFGEEEARHLLTVLRRKTGDRMQVTDGQGFIYETELLEVSKKQASARVISQKPHPDERPCRLHIGISPVKMMERFEWFLEKATEIGVDEITPLLCHRTERQNLRRDRMEKILVSAMKQSYRAVLPKLNDLMPFEKLVKNSGEEQKFIPWIPDDGEPPHLKTMFSPGKTALVLIGPEGDFSGEEIALALKNGFRAAGLGKARLRTETAGVLAVSIGNLTDTGLL